MEEPNDHATIGTKEAAKELHVLQATVSKLCREGKLPGATQDAKGSPWRILLRRFGQEKRTGAPWTTEKRPR